MTKTERIAEITATMKSFGKENYQKSEVLPELFTLQDEIVGQTFGIESTELTGLKIWDVENKLAERNEALGHVADDSLNRFKNGSKNICNLIKSEISGNRGERQTFDRLETIKGSYRLLKNVEITSKSGRTELDGVVLTRKGAFIIEVKNTRKNILIDEEGNYYRMGEYMNWDSNIGEKMKMREALLREILSANGYPECRITSIVVFTNKQVEVKNKDRSLKTTFLGPLPYIIDEYAASDQYSDVDLDSMENAIEMNRCRESYAMDIDIDQYKKDFATVIVQLEEAEARVKHQITLKSFFLRIFAPEKVPAAA